MSNPRKRRVVHQDNLKAFEGTGRFTEDEEASEPNVPLLSPTDDENTKKDKALDDLADLFMPHSAQLSDVPCTLHNTPNGNI